MWVEFSADIQNRDSTHFYLGNRMLFFPQKNFCCIPFFSNFAPTKPPFWGLAGQYLNGILRLRTPFVRTAKGEKAFCGRYPWREAMRRPGLWDGRKVGNSHAFYFQT